MVFIEALLGNGIPQSSYPMIFENYRFKGCRVIPSGAGEPTGGVILLDFKSNRG